MAGFGAELRSERELRGISLEKLCAETKVRPAHFEALEQGDYKALPNGVFRKGIVRAYLHSLGLDEAEWMVRFDASFAEHMRQLGVSEEPDEEAWRKFADNVRRSRPRKRDSQRLRWIGVLILLALVGGGGWALWWYYLRFRLGA